MVKISNISYILLNIIFFVVIVITNEIKIDIFIILLTYINLIILHKFNFKVFFITLLLTIPTWLSFYIAGFIYSKTAPHDIAAILTVRISAITISSIMLVMAVDFEELILFFMQKLKLPVFVGYPLLSAINSLSEIKKDFQQINTAYYMRYQKRLNFIKTLFPLLISAVRHAHFNGLSMECRGLNHHKTFIHKAESYKLVDIWFIGLNIFALLIMYMLKYHL